jgi:hypothetical protein
LWFLDYQKPQASAIETDTSGSSVENRTSNFEHVSREPPNRGFAGLKQSGLGHPP